MASSICSQHFLCLRRVVSSVIIQRRDHSLSITTHLCCLFGISLAVNPLVILSSTDLLHSIVFALCPRNTNQLVLLCPPFHCPHPSTLYKLKAVVRFLTISKPCHFVIDSRLYVVRWLHLASQSLSFLFQHIGNTHKHKRVAFRSSACIICFCTRFTHHRQLQFSA